MSLTVRKIVVSSLIRIIVLSGDIRYERSLILLTSSV